MFQQQKKPLGFKYHPKNCQLIISNKKRTEVVLVMKNSFLDI